MSIMDSIFGKSTPVSTSQPTGQSGQPSGGQPAGGQPAGAQPGVTPQGQQSGGGQPASAHDAPNAGVPAAGSQEPSNPLDAFKGIFDNKGDQNQDVAPAFALEADTLNKVAASLDFTKAVDEGLMQRVQSGDTNALLQAMNAIAQQAYSTGLQHTASLTDKFVQSRAEYDAKALPKQVHGVLTHQALSSDDIPDHPVIKAQLSATAKQIAAQYPDASPAWVAQQARQYITELSNALNPPAANAGQPKQDEAVDWDKYFTE